VSSDIVFFQSQRKNNTPVFKTLMDDVHTLERNRIVMRAVNWLPTARYRTESHQCSSEFSGRNSPYSPARRLVCHLIQKMARTLSTEEFHKYLRRKQDEKTFDINSFISSVCAVSRRRGAGTDTPLSRHAPIRAANNYQN
jgi:hypothetical protein